MNDHVLEDRFALEAPIARGTSGQVYEAQDLVTGTKVAVKILHPRSANNEEFVARFRRECRLLHALDHPNAVKIVSTGISPSGLPYVVMELVRGRTISRLVHEEGPIAAGDMARYLEEMAAILDAAHQAGIVHRDLKPGNIMIGKNEDGREQVKVLDFGVAKILDADQSNSTFVTAAGIAVGTPEYMSPEQATGRPIDHRTDIYSLGVTVYAALTGELPFEGKNHLQIMLAHVKQPPPPMRQRNPSISVTPAVEAVVRRALAKEPESRFDSASAFAAAFRQAVEHPELFVEEPNAPKVDPAHAFVDTRNNAPLEHGSYAIVRALESFPVMAALVVVAVVVGAIAGSFRW